MLLILCTNCFSQDPVFEWARQIDRRQGSEEGYFMGVDGDKNVYVAGRFRNTIDLDPGPGQFNVTALPLDQIYIVKLNAAGNFVWGKSIGGTRFTWIKYLHVDLAGNIYMTGLFSGTTDFDPGPAIYPFTATLTLGTENFDMFTAKLDRNGDFIWARSAGNLAVDGGYSVMSDAAGNTYTTGHVTGLVDFDPGPGVAMAGTNGLVCTFITKHDNLGNFVWVKEFRSNSTCFALCIKLDRANNIYVSGDFDGTVDFDPGPSVFTLSTPFNFQSPYIAKLDGAGNFIWAKNQSGSWFVVNDEQEVYSFNKGVIFQGFLEKYDISGNLMWSKLMGGRPSTWPEGNGPIAIDNGSNIYLTGEFNFTKDFDPSSSSFNMTAFGGGFNVDAFFCRFDRDGNFIWAKQIGGIGEEHPTSVFVDTSGAIYSTGIFVTQVDFDPGTGVFQMTPFSGGGTYIHKMNRCLGVTYHSMEVTSCTAYTLNSHTYTQSGVYTQTLTNSIGCDSIITLNLTIESATTDIAITSCDSYTWNSNVLTVSGVYTHTYTTVNGCDSTVNLHLTIRNSISTTLNISICEGMVYEGYSISGTYIDHFTASNGCDSARILNLQVIPRKQTSLNATICNGENFLGYTLSGTYTDLFTSSDGCDSVRILHLVVNPTYNITLSKSICSGDSYLGHTVSGTYVDRFTTVAGCDSVQTTVLTVLEKPRSGLGKDTALCARDTLVLRPGIGDSYLWQDGSVNNYYIVRAPGTYTVSVKNSCGTTNSSIIISEGPCLSYFPSAFTPNNDGLNDRFGILNPRGITEYHLVIYNRWGEKIFESRNPLLGWDGKYNGLLLDTGIFVWQSTFKYYGATKYFKGTVSLLR